MTIKIDENDLRNLHQTLAELPIDQDFKTGMIELTETERDLLVAMLEMAIAFQKLCSIRIKS